MDVIGWIGVAVAVGSHLMLVTERLRPLDGVYLTGTITGALLIGTNAAAYGSWPAAALEVVWVGVTLVGVARALGRRKAEARSRRGR